MKDPFKLLIFLLAAVAVGLTIAFFLPERESEATKPSSPSSASEDRKDREIKGPAIDPEKEVELQISEQKPPARADDEDGIAIPVEGKPMVITLLDYPELGEISIAEYSDELGDFTGKPLKSGTRVQIRNPQKKGEILWFLVP